MNKLFWYFFSGALLIMAISSYYISMSISCFPYNDYGFYYYCRHFRTGMMFKAMLYFIGSMLCFGKGNKK